jgi:dolichol kinase
LIAQDITLAFNGFLIALLLNLPILVVGLLILLSTGLARLLRKRFDSKVNYFQELEVRTLKKIESMSKARIDNLRKINHVLIFIGLFGVWSIGFSVVMYFSGSWTGMIPSENNMLLIYIQLFTNSKSISEVLFSFGWFYYILFYFFYAFFFIMLANEFTRKNSQYIFPFNYMSRLLLSEDEKQGLGTYFYFAIGQMFATFLCPPMVFFAILGMSSIGDLMASQVGIRYGKNHISWNQKKTWEGTISATICCFFICLFFVGVIWGLIFSIAFLIFDVFTGKGFRNINLSDNLLIPIGCALLYLFIRFSFNLDYYTIIILWF